MAMTVTRLAEINAETMRYRTLSLSDSGRALCDNNDECVAEIDRLRTMLKRAGRELLRHGNPYGAEIGREFPYEEAGSEE